MNKLAVGPEAKGLIDIEKPLIDNLKAIAKAKHKDVEDLTTIVLDRDRHVDVIAEIRMAGARIRLIPDGDVAVDPIDGTRPLAFGRSNSLATVAIAPRGSMFNPGPFVYMNKLSYAVDVKPVMTSIKF